MSLATDRSVSWVSRAYDCAALLLWSVSLGYLPLLKGDALEILATFKIRGGTGMSH